MIKVPNNALTRDDLDLLTTKQDFLRPARLSTQDEKRLAELTREERALFGSRRPMAKDGLQRLVKVTPTKNIYIAKTVENTYVTTETYQVLKEIEQRFGKRQPKGFFIIVSLSRTFEEEMKANKMIANDSTHGIGEAVDFAGKFMRLHFPEAAWALEQVLQEMEKEGKIFFLNEEDSTAFWHVARNPTRSKKAKVPRSRIRQNHRVLY